MSKKESYPNLGCLTKREGSPYWYIRYTAPNGRRIYRTTKCADFEAAVEYANRTLKIEEGGAGKHWERHINACMKNSKSWLRELIRKVQYRNKKMKNAPGKWMSARDVKQIALRSCGYCELTGVPFSLENPTKSKTPPFKPSLDRIRSDMPYSYDNCRMITVAANLSLRDWGDDVFRAMCVGFATKELRKSAPKSEENFATPIVMGGYKVSVTS